MKEWYHGTNFYFEQWKLSETTSIYKPELLPHSFISFSTDDELLKGAGNGLCKIKINENSNIVNLLDNNSFSKELWNKIKKHPFGAYHIATKDFSQWKDACLSGVILRPHILHNQDFLLWKNNLYKHSNIKAIQMVEQNFVRHWIEFFMQMAKSIGIDGLICNEHTQHGQNGPRTSLNFYAFDINSISKPHWLNIPNNNNLLEHVDLYKNKDIQELVKWIRSYKYPFSY